MLDETHDPRLRSWVESANDGATEFPIQNLPLGVFRNRASDEPWRIGMAIGELIFDVSSAARQRLLPEALSSACQAGSLNALMSLGRGPAVTLRVQLSRLLRADTAEGNGARAQRERLLREPATVEMAVPSIVGDYTDFYASIHHATNIGRMLRPDNPLLPNYKWVPIGYHGRASSIVVSGTPVRRPSGQQRADAAVAPTLAPSKRLDYEAEVGFFVGEGNALGKPIAMKDAERHLFGACLVNDWSARDIQAWEYQPLGPFLAKDFATTVSPWVVSWEALEPFRRAPAGRAEGDPAPLAYLASDENTVRGAIDVTIEVYLQTERMRRERIEPVRLSRGSLADMYWTPAQFVAHHTSNGCNLLPGDLLASGTVSGAASDSRGCLMELTWRGTQPITMPGGEVRSFLEDGDEVILRGFCEREGFARIGFGDCRGRIVASS